MDAKVLAYLVLFSTLFLKAPAVVFSDDSTRDHLLPPAQSAGVNIHRDARARGLVAVGYRYQVSTYRATGSGLL